MVNGKTIFPPDTVFLVTGAAGFIGSNLVEALLAMGHRVRGLDNFFTGRIENIEPFTGDPLFQFIEGDIRDAYTCKHMCEGVDYVLHQAALSSVSHSIDNPILCEEINTNGTLKLMDAARSCDVRKFIYASSAAVYGDSVMTPKAEGVEGRPLSPYAVSKLSCENYAMCYWQIYGLPTIGLRYFNIFGPRQDPHSEYASVIPRFITSLLNDERVVIYGDGEQSRDFTHVQNVVTANFQACLSSTVANGQVFNIACGESTSLNHLWVTLRELLGKNTLPEYGLERPGDIRHSQADISKARCYLGYIPSLGLFNGLEQTLQWYMDYQQHRVLRL